MPSKRIYIYGVMPNFYSPDMFRTFEDSGIYAIPLQNISAVVSDRDDEDIDYLDRESLGYLLVHHQETIEGLQNKGFNMFIPMKLGTIVSSKEEVVKLLANGHDLIIETLKKVEFLTEIDLAVTWANFGGVIQEVAAHPEIVALREEILNKANALSQLDQVKVGMMIKEKLDKKNKQVELRILDALSSISIDIKTHEVMNDQMITNSAFLLNNNNKDKFEAKIDKLDAEFEDALSFKLVGPLPCYSFYTLEVIVLDPVLVEQAKNDLDLNDETSETEIKKAYLTKAKLFHPDTNQHNGNQESFNRINKSYHILLDYTTAAKQSSKDEKISLTKENVAKNLILVKLKD